MNKIMAQVNQYTLTDQQKRFLNFFIYISGIKQELMLGGEYISRKVSPILKNGVYTDDDKEYLNYLSCHFKPFLEMDTNLKNEYKLYQKTYRFNNYDLWHG